MHATAGMGSAEARLLSPSPLPSAPSCAVHPLYRRRSGARCPQAQRSPCRTSVKGRMGHSSSRFLGSPRAQQSDCCVNCRMVYLGVLSRSNRVRHSHCVKFLWLSSTGCERIGDLESTAEQCTANGQHTVTSLACCNPHAKALSP
jgi:hypothetical protein